MRSKNNAETDEEPLKNLGHIAILKQIGRTMILITTAKPSSCTKWHNFDEHLAGKSFLPTGLTCIIPVFEITIDKINARKDS